MKFGCCSVLLFHVFLLMFLIVSFQFCNAIQCIRGRSEDELMDNSTVECPACVIYSCPSGYGFGCPSDFYDFCLMETETIAFIKNNTPNKLKYMNYRTAYFSGWETEEDMDQMIAIFEKERARWSPTMEYPIWYYETPGDAPEAEYFLLANSRDSNDVKILTGIIMVVIGLILVTVLLIFIYMKLKPWNI